MGLWYEKEAYKIVGACMEVHRNLGRGFNEVVYKDALEIEFNGLKIPFERERRYDVLYKGVKLPHFYVADFVLFDTIILEAKAVECLTQSHVKQTFNYLAASGLHLGLLVNFGEDSLKSQRIVL
ncbi:GxxExxY protein [Porphyromonas loveana]|uniref:GxxExxY protein n=1 Tax=Porphyromonas loveana TaxID=1884669 RepID=A0A2U1FKX5_9PORP|nr:GxxExxY protein [Porphyromonas loveana]PVZ12809.1 GxxExxY protein [Porphyromonas loveana]